MIISRTPFRISFFGGGTDYPAWYHNKAGAVLSTTIDKYCYITCRYLPPFFDHKYRILYSKVETVKHVSEIVHPAVKAILQFTKIKGGLEIHHDGDLPARTGLGSSSSFTVGMLNAVYALKGITTSKYRLAKEAIKIERCILREHVGSQDQIAAAYGGFNKINFGNNDEFFVEPIILPSSRLAELQDHLVLIFTGFSRFASKVAEKQIKITPKKEKELTSMYKMVDEARDILSGGTNINEFGKLLNESWCLKKSLTDKISTPVIDQIYAEAIKAGATGGKLLGAGGGGFLLFFVKPNRRNNVKHRLRRLLEVGFKFENVGSQIIFYQDQGMH